MFKTVENKVYIPELINWLLNCIPYSFGHETQKSVIDRIDDFRDDLFDHFEFCFLVSMFCVAK